MNRKHITTLSILVLLVTAAIVFSLRGETGDSSTNGSSPPINGVDPSPVSIDSSRPAHTPLVERQKGHQTGTASPPAQANLNHRIPAWHPSARLASLKQRFRRAQTEMRAIRAELARTADPQRTERLKRHERVLTWRLKRLRHAIPVGP